ncbi:MAG TPA: ABC transporter permease [Patescibacteria group bacterium]|nr:ABC transporter permease [Patescibacteria group bacterium]
MNVFKQLILPIIKYKFLLIQLTGKEIKARYKQSFVGYAWVLLNPLSQLLVYSFVFSIVFRFPTNNVPYIIYLYAALLPWTFSQNAIATATQSLVENASLLRKVSFPREVIPYASVISKIVDLFFSGILFLAMTVIMRVPLAPTAILFIPLFAAQLLLTTGLSLLFSSLNLFYRDVQYLTNLLMMLWMYMTPIVYPLSLVPDRYVKLYKLNPMVGIIEGYRSALFGYPFETSIILWSVAISIIVFFAGFILFKRSEKIFADIV